VNVSGKGGREMGGEEEAFGCVEGWRVIVFRFCRFCRFCKFGVVGRVA
jgi:hypothetical protein